MDHPRRVFLKLGGSLITNKNQAMTPQLEVIQRLADEIASAISASPGLQLMIGHGSGSFGHDVADRYQTLSGGSGRVYWQGFSEVWQAARALNQIVLQAFARANLPVVVFPPSAAVITKNRQVISWDTQPIQAALTHGLIPMVYGDVVFDAELGGTILSTEDLFQYLASCLHPQQILIAGLDQGVYYDPNKPGEFVSLITPQNLEDIRPALSPSQAVDVTGGMLAKVEAMVALVKEDPALKVNIFSGASPGMLKTALMHQTVQVGTAIINQAAQ